MRQSAAEAGSALIYILVAIVLFAALGVAVSRINSGATPGNSESLELQASEILQFSQAVRTAVQEITVNGVTETQISFENPTAGGYANAGCATDSCRIFASSGGGLSYVKPQDQWLDSSHSASAGYGDWIFSGNNAVTGVGSDGGGDSSVELLVILPYVKKELCAKINAMLGIDNPTGNPPQDDAATDVTDKFIGTYTGSIVMGGNAQVTGQRAACIQDSGAPATAAYHFFRVLSAR